MSLQSDLQKALGGQLEPRSALATRTSMRVGGVADLLAAPQTEEALAQAIDVCVQHGTPFSVLGGGTNTIVSDAGVRGVVVRLGSLKIEEGTSGGDRVSFKLGAGHPLARLIQLAREHDCVGMELVAGIPGTVGGAVAMNAGTRAGSISAICTEIGVCGPGHVRALPAAEVGFGYRQTDLPELSVVSWARFELKAAEPAEVQRSKQTVEKDLAARRRSQPLSLPNAGSIFRNPPGDYAARLIQDCGLKGTRLGDAQVSELHANFIVNRGAATARDVVALVRRMQDAVLEKHGVLLVPEIKLIGEFDPAELPRGLGPSAKPTA
jgi:UDP-N-acetylmuramate dehydrogenase